MSGQAGLFDVDDRLKRLSDLGDQLEAFAAAVDFEVFRPELDRALAYSDGAKCGRPADVEAAVPGRLAGHAHPNPGLLIGRPAICACAAPQGRVQGAVTENFFVKRLGRGLRSATEGARSTPIW
jgi:hypothetical protein